MINESLHTDLELSKGEFFVKSGQQNYRIGKILKGVLRGFTVNNEGEEVTTHFFIENDLLSGNYIPNIPAIVNTPQMKRTTNSKYIGVLLQYEHEILTFLMFAINLNARI